ncbi:unnamed protein product [Brassica oleracea var. botrytis]|uniref:Uncharacterized protein n=2 Tax=Brassica TaxID=3705 RepID=A0A3P6F719_BRAOL|nr:unnamed protein product [Brassica napus]CDY62236.1 BnaUnng00740D [Brassica napus]VDD43164.1 unnamed protein product [Brassica oleracea]
MWKHASQQLYCVRTRCAQEDKDKMETVIGDCNKRNLD